MEDGEHGRSTPTGRRPSRGRAVTKRPPWVAVAATLAPLFGLVACADLWGFDDLTLATDGGPQDGTTADDAPAVGPEGSDAEADGANEMADASVDATNVRSEDGGSRGDAGVRDAGAPDAGDDGAAAGCRAACPTGCCDAMNHCQPMSQTACGTGGAACVDCTADASCMVLAPVACCGATTGQCGCAAPLLACSAK
jgi:hypothetical protein